MSNRSCRCGSGLEKHANYDARGIFLCYTCQQCHQREMGKYRQDVLRDPNYHADEQED